MIGNHEFLHSRLRNSIKNMQHRLGGSALLRLREKFDSAGVDASHCIFFLSAWIWSLLDILHFHGVRKGFARFEAIDTKTDGRTTRYERTKQFRLSIPVERCGQGADGFISPYPEAHADPLLDMARQGKARRPNTNTVYQRSTASSYSQPKGNILHYCDEVLPLSLTNCICMDKVRERGKSEVKAGGCLFTMKAV